MPTFYLLPILFAFLKFWSVALLLCVGVTFQALAYFSFETWHTDLRMPLSDNSNTITAFTNETVSVRTVLSAPIDSRRVVQSYQITELSINRSVGGMIPTFVERNCLQ